MQELKYKYPVQRRTQEDIVTETVNLVDLHCEPVGTLVTNVARSAAHLQRVELCVTLMTYTCGQAD